MHSGQAVTVISLLRIPKILSVQVWKFQRSVSFFASLFFLPLALWVHSASLTWLSAETGLLAASTADDTQIRESI